MGTEIKLTQYLGTKFILATPMTRIDAETFHAVVCGGDKNGDGYLVVYENGYKSWSPKDVFENAYRKTNALNFGLALEALQLGYKVARKGWNGKGIYIGLQKPDEHSKMTGAYIYIDTTGLETNNTNAPKSLVPWIASQTDMLTDDWVIYNN